MENKEKKMHFLQSLDWQKFQEAIGRKTLSISGENFCANIIEHKLPIIGKYFYCPRGPVMEHEALSTEQRSKISEFIELAKKENAGWIRIEPATEKVLQIIKKNSKNKITKAPHDMQPKENFVIDISKTKEELLLEMKPKTRYNISIAKKKGVEIIVCKKGEVADEKYIEEFLRLTKEMAKRQGISTHPEGYYKKMIEIFSEEILKLYIAKYEEKIIAANLILFYGNTATYLHGASSNEDRNAMAPYLLQWQAILDAKEHGCVFYDFGGIKNNSIKKDSHNDWAGITKFKTGFSKSTEPTVFSGSYDIVINNWKYKGYRLFSLLFGFYKKFAK